MRTLAVCLLLALPVSVAAAQRSHTHTQPHPRPHLKKPVTRAQIACPLGCRIHRERVAVRYLRSKVLRRSLQAYLPNPRPAHLTWRHAQVRHELAWWKRIDRLTRMRARIPLSRRIPRWNEWQCIARFESTKRWNMAPPSSGGAYWGGLQMNIEFQRTYGADMIRRHHGGLANTWTAPEQITVANRAWKTRGYWPWPNTARACGLL
jgi:hypothetical protein